MHTYKMEIKKVIHQKYPELKVVFTQSPKVEMGHLAIPCFDFAKELHQSPKVIADKLVDIIALLPFISKAVSLGGYVNCFIEPITLGTHILGEVLAKGSFYGSNQSGVGRKVLLEHTSINPNASPHVGRARNAMIGDVISRLLRFQQFEVDVHYFVNDIGKQIAMLLMGTLTRDDVTFKDLLSIYVEVNNQLKEQPELEHKVFELLHQLEEGDVAIREKFRKLVKICIDGQTQILNELGIHYDTFDYESDYLYNNRLREILQMYHQCEGFEEDEQGRYVLNQEGLNLPMKSPYLVLTRHDKTSLYPLRDIAYTIDKMELGHDRNIIVLGEDQKLYHRQIGAALKVLGYEAPEVIHYAFVILAEGKMATRNGTVVLLEDFMEEALMKAKDALEKRYECVEDSLAKAIAYGAVRFAILKTSNDKNVIFDMNTALSFEGESGPYLQYSLARIHSILKKAEAESIKEDLEICLKEPEEIELLLEIGRMEEVIAQASEHLSPHIIANYVYHITQLFSKFYHKHAVLKAETKEVRDSRIMLLKGLSQVIKNCFTILGIEAIEKM